MLHDLHYFTEEDVLNGGGTDGSHTAVTYCLLVHKGKKDTLQCSHLKWIWN